MTKTVIKGNKQSRRKAIKIEGTQKTIKTFRLLNTDIKKLQRIASKKKATQTRVISELVRLAYAGLFIPPLPQLNEFYKTLLSEIESTKQDEIKRKVLK